MCLTCSYLPLMLPTCNTSHLLARAALIHPTMSSWDHRRGMHTGVNHTVQLFQAQASEFDSARRSRAHRTCTRLTCKVHSVCMAAGRTRCPLACKSPAQAILSGWSNVRAVKIARAASSFHRRRRGKRKQHEDQQRTTNNDNTGGSHYGHPRAYCESPCLRSRVQSAAVRDGNPHSSSICHGGRDYTQQFSICLII